jgi:homoserine/homoserine lactone efflux protein
MDITLFSLTALGFTAIPGPNAALIIATTLAHNAKKGLQAALGINVGVALHLIFALVSTHWLMSFVTESINWFAWMISVLVIYFVIRGLFSRFRTSSKPNLSGAMSFSRALGISITNPKGLIFFALILPPFLDKSGNTHSQSIAFSSWFLVLTLIVDIAYVLFAKNISKLIHHSKTRKFLAKHQRLARYRFKSWLKQL